MAKITVHLLNFHGPFSHIEIVLQDPSNHTFYRMNRWVEETPVDVWESTHGADPYQFIAQASSKLSFDIQADPKAITEAWKTYWEGTKETASILRNNCAVATQWFLNKFADIPEPDLSNLSLNHLAFGILWPSFIPCPILLPGRVMSNAKFHIAAKQYPELAAKYSHLFLNISMALAVLAFGLSVLTLSIAATVLTGGIATAAIIGCVALGAASTHGFFKAYNLSSKKIISENPSENPCENLLAPAPWLNVS